MQPLRRKHLYEDYIRFPFDAADGPLEELIREAARSEAPIAEWKRRFIGEPFDPRAFASLFERHRLQGHPPVQLDPTRSFTTLAFADELAEHPELLRTYAETFTPGDDASLLLWAPGRRRPGAAALAETAIGRAGLDGDSSRTSCWPRTPGSPEADLRLSERADAVLSEWPSIGRIGELPRFGAGESAALRSAAAAPALAA